MADFSADISSGSNHFWRKSRKKKIRKSDNLYYSHTCMLDKKRSISFVAATGFSLSHICNSITFVCVCGGGGV